MYYVVSCFKDENKDGIVLGEFDYKDVPTKHGLLKVMEDSSKSLEERERACEEYDCLMGEHKGYYVPEGDYLPGDILENIPEDAEPIPDFEVENWESCCERLESDKILKKLKTLKSGVYCCFDGEFIDMVYQASERTFLSWINQHTDLNIIGGARRPLSVQDRYNILMTAQDKGFVFGRIPEGWGNFEGNMVRMERNKGINRVLIRKV